MKSVSVAVAVLKKSELESERHHQIQSESLSSPASTHSFIHSSFLSFSYFDRCIRDLSQAKVIFAVEPANVLCNKLKEDPMEYNANEREVDAALE